MILLEKIKIGKVRVLIIVYIIAQFLLVFFIYLKNY